MANFIPVDHYTCAALRRSYVVAPDAQGHWVAREKHGLIEGVFLTQRDAVRFAIFETGGRATAVVSEPAPAPAER